MALRITQYCVGCWACAGVCPNQAIQVVHHVFTILTSSCQECDGDYPDPQCGAICPIEEAIVDAHDQAINPPGSLTGVPIAVRRHVQSLLQ
ncbi:MAG: 4Fe-4S binding protein [Magnetococcales bacterium]|nr:4Fe-4S binding protein [Magnetococcales bacterium]